MGHLTLTSPPSTAPRLVLAAPLWWLGVAILAAAFVPAWRRRPLTATPALMATLAWWPVPLPAIALLWTGRLAWVPVALALLSAALSGRQARPAPAKTTGGIRRSVWSAGILSAIAACVVAWSLAPRLPGGDEPNYLVITQSLIKDGDLRVENNYDQRDYAAFYPGVLPHDWLRRGRGEVAYSIHAPGLPVLVLPAFALFGYRGAQATVIALAGVTGALLWALGWIATGNRRAAWFAWAAVALSSTTLIQSATIFPDAPGACCVAVLVLLAAALERDPARVSGPALAGASVVAAALPWLHTRFVVLAAGMGALVVWRLLRDPAASASARWKRVAWFLALPALSAAAWFGFFHVVYGTFSPAAPYGPNQDTKLAYVPGGMAALLFDQTCGLLTYAPVLAMAALAFTRARPADARRFDRMLVVVAVAYFAAVSVYWMWWAGVPAPPARFATAALPLLVIPIARAWQRASAVGRAAGAALLAISCALSVLLIAVGRGTLVWNVYDAPAGWLRWVGTVVDLQRGWPSFFWRLTPGNVVTERPFGLHVAVWAGWFGGSAAALSAVVARTPRARAHAAVLSAWWLMIAVMIALQLGWTLDGAGGIDASHSQLQALDAALSGGAAASISPFAVHRVSDPGQRLRIRVNRPVWDTLAPARWDALDHVPAAAYRVTVWLRRPLGGALSFRVGDSARLLRTFVLGPATEQSFVLSLPVAIRDLGIEPDAALASVAQAIDFEPMAGELVRGGYARASLSFDSTDVFFLDDDAFVEDTGFWVKGGSSTEIDVSAPSGQAAVRMNLVNGGARNTVTVDDGVRAQTVALQPSEARVVSIPTPKAGVLHLRITSPEGFRPSAAGGSDSRYLGVRVEEIK